MEMIQTAPHTWKSVKDAMKVAGYNNSAASYDEYLVKVLGYTRGPLAARVGFRGTQIHRVVCVYKAEGNVIFIASGSCYCGSRRWSSQSGRSYIQVIGSDLSIVNCERCLRLPKKKKNV